MKLPCASVLQSSGALRPLIGRVIADWRGKRAEAERAASLEGWAQRDELVEVSEQLDTLFEAYNDLDAGHGDEAVDGDDASDSD